jgi:hypothetical protein
MKKSERWKPEYGDSYWLVSALGKVEFVDWRSDEFDGKCFEFGNFFETAEEAESAAEKVKALLLSLHDNGETLQDSIQDKQLPDWCKVGEWVWDVEDSRYVKVISITDKVLLRTKSKCTYYEELKDMAGNYKQARLRPYNAEEMRGLIGKVIETQKDIAMVLGYSSERNKICVATINNYFSAETLLAVGATIDGKPCGVLEHLENGEWVE